MSLLRTSSIISVWRDEQNHPGGLCHSSVLMLTSCLFWFLGFFLLYSEGEVGNKSYLFIVLLFYPFIMEILKNTQK